jgi:hypothetical protein
MRAALPAPHILRCRSHAYRHFCRDPDFCIARLADAQELVARQAGFDGWQG